MASVVNTFAILGIEGYKVEVETTTLPGQPALSIIGLGDQAVKEAGDRIQAAFDACGYDFPKKKVIINLAPGDRKKTGSHFDLAMAIGLLLQTDSITGKNVGQYSFIGELSLNGDLRPCKGILPMVMAAKKCGINKVIVPAMNAEEAALVKEIDVCGLNNLSQVIDLLEGKNVCTNDHHIHFSEDRVQPEWQMDFIDVIGQDDVIDAAVLAAAGGHNMLMIGAPGCGKTMIAQRIPSILPRMTEEEQLEVTKIHSIAGFLEKKALITERPFRAPHHNASLNALIGGGTNAMPGEVSLAHNGVLFLDELPEYSRHTLDALRQPIEDRKVTISRVNMTNTYPANFMLVAAMNPCPCGYHPGAKCRCTDYEIIKYRGRVSGPIMDRIDIQKEVHAVGFFEMKGAKSRSSESLRKIVEAARKIQTRRFADIPGYFCNAQMKNEQIQKYCQLNQESTAYLKQICDKYGYSARVIHKLLKLARTSADLHEHVNIELGDICFVLKCRDLDQSNGDMLVVS